MKKATPKTATKTETKAPPAPASVSFRFARTIRPVQFESATVDATYTYDGSISAEAAVARFEQDFEATIERVINTVED